MPFELTEALIDDILFSMEDQDGYFMLDTLEGVVVGGDDDDLLADEEESEDTADRLISLPEWDSVSGFRLMERFASGLRNPLIREELSSALGRGRGVFRAFKDALSRYPEAEKLWFTYKEREMKREIITWYNGLREEWGLEKIGMEPEETADLVLEDFRFIPFQMEDLAKAEELHRQCMDEHKEILAESGARDSAGILLEEVFSLSNNTNNLFKTIDIFPPVGAMSAESSGGDFAGFISGVIKDSVMYIQCLEVKAEYRGLGIGETLLVRFLESLDPKEIRAVLLDLPFWADGFSRLLLRESFKPYTVRYWLNLKERAN